jgi:hypothetical protein
MITWILLLAGGIYVLAALGLFWERPRLARPLLFAPVLAMAMVALGLLADAPRAPNGPYGKTWASLDGLAFDLPAVGEVRLGGDVQNDDVVIAANFRAAADQIGRGRLPPGFLHIRPAGQGVSLTLGPQSGPGDLAVVRIESGGRKTYLGARRLPAGLRPCVMNCGGDGAQFARVRKGQVYDGLATPLAASAGGPPRALYFAPLEDDRLWSAADAATDVLPLAKDDDVKITVFEAVPPTPQRGSIPAEPGRLVARRGFDLAYDGRWLSLRPWTPETLGLSLTGPQNERPAVRLASAAASDDPPPMGEVDAIFGLLGRSFDAELSQMRLDAPHDSTQPAILHLADGGQVPVTGRIRLGVARRIEVELRPLDLRSGLGPWLWLFAASSLAASLGASWRLRLQDPIAAMLFGAVDIALALRLLVAVEGAFVDSATKAQQAVEAALVAIPLAAFVALAAHPRAWDARFGGACLAGLALVAAILGYVSTGVVSETAKLAPFILLAAGTAAAFRLPQRALAALDWRARSAVRRPAPLAGRWLWPGPGPNRGAIWGAGGSLLLRAG